MRQYFRDARAYAKQIINFSWPNGRFALVVFTNAGLCYNHTQ